jgi:ATP/ADP translocase
VLEIFEIPKEERPKTLLLTLYFFLIIAAFWIQKPLRTSKFVKTVGVENLPWAKLGTALLILPVMMLYSAVIRRMPRGYAAFTCSLVFIGGSLFFWRVFSGQAPDWAHYTYFFYIDIYITVMLAAFWSLAHATTPPDQAKRTYAVVGAGGILGGAVGSALTGWLVKAIDSGYLMLVCAGVLSAVYLGLPTVAIAALLFSSDATFHYSINQTSKETLYTPTDEAVKYQAKAFIDMFVFRVAKGVSALMILFVNLKLKPAGWDAPKLGLISLAFVLAWAYLARGAGRRFDALSATPAA